MQSQAFNCWAPKRSLSVPGHRRLLVACHASKHNSSKVRDVLKQYKSLQLPTGPAQHHGPGLVQLNDIAGCGRGLVASQDLLQGQLVVECSPLAVVHGMPGSTPGVSQLAPVLAQAAAAPDGSTDAATLQQSKAFWSLSSGKSASPDSPSTPEQQQQLLQQLVTVPKIAPRTSATGNKREQQAALLAAKQRAQVNGYGEPYQDVVTASIRSEQFRSFLGVWPAMAMINHSCAPNASTLVVGDTMMVRAAKPIPAGDEVLISYAGPRASSPIAVRRQALKAGFGFECECQRCLVEQDYEDEPVGQAALEIYQQVEDQLKPALLEALDRGDATAVAKIQSKLEAAVAKYKAALKQVEDEEDVAVLRTAVLPLCLELLSLCFSIQGVGSPVKSLGKQKPTGFGKAPTAKGAGAGTKQQLQARLERLEYLGTIAPGSYAQAQLAYQAFVDAHSALGPDAPASQAALQACIDAHSIRYGPISDMDQLAALLCAHFDNNLADDMAAAVAAQVTEGQ